MNTTTFILTEDKWQCLLKTQNDILQLLKSQYNQPTIISKVSHVTAREFMDAVYIQRTKFDQLVAENKIKIVKKKRRIYVPFEEIERFFKDPDVR